MQRSSLAPLLRQAARKPRAKPPTPRRTYSAVAPLAHPSISAARFPVQKRYGQPLPSTHPHLLAPGELTPGISADEYEARRRALMDSLDDGSTVIVSGNKVMYMSHHCARGGTGTNQVKRQLQVPPTQQPLVPHRLGRTRFGSQKTSSEKGYRMTMFVRPQDPYDESWNGPRSGPEGACEVFGADDVRPSFLLSKSILTRSDRTSMQACDVAHFSRRLEDALSSSRGPVYIDLPDISASSFSRSRPTSTSNRTSFFDYLSSAGSKRTPVDDVDRVLGALGKRDVRSAAREIEKLRVVKSEAEVRVMKKAADISADAHSKVMRFCGARSGRGLTEHSLVSHFEYNTSLAGSPRPAYVPVCGSGSHALTIHYIENNRPLREGDLVLIDAGCEWGGYASDITRTFPVSGTFTTPQAHLYEAVLRVHRKCISLCTSSSNLSLDDLHRISVDLTRTELRDLGFQLRGGELERVLYPHFLSHPLGVDLHDTPSFMRDEKCTIEPGLYVPPLPHLPVGFHNLAIRIEDEVLVRDEDQVVLSVNAPKELVDVEARCRGLLEGAGEQ
ncbi:SPOSA6832_02273 [Sporobolomyces salmonicolor]|uniref:SPOSA6832_02273-mRNA-1:cds n=1 Tax=Sporidiobolus salmonicolor TaxID=5005 RepID=A0A0D6ELW8_SPOSA|nr:SPOSA6832_02273 [Sporobolomyces salmonicolor]